MIGACVTYQAKRADRGIIFSHEKHPAQDMACQDCHAVDAGEPAMPSHDVCGVCHDEKVDVSKSKECGYCHSNPEQSVKPYVKALAPEIIFTHAAHTAKSVECKMCHAGKDPVAAIPKLNMAACMDCHKKTKPELTECAVCHKEQRKDVKPKYRGAARIQHDSPELWESLHGAQSKFDPAYCEICHEQQSFCEDCHRKNPPKSHTLAWRKKEHGLRSEWDREKCSACHDEDSCIRCHKNNQPSSHRGGWGPPAERHCVTCHYPEQDNNCTVCHESIEHDTAMRSPHALGIYPMRCSRCHPFNNPYRAPHVLNSTVRCAVCH
jgi:hypothetical protein